MKTRHGTIISDCNLINPLADATVRHYEQNPGGKGKPQDDNEVPTESGDPEATATAADSEAPKSEKKLRLALASTLTVPGIDIISVFLKLSLAKNFDDFKEAMSGVRAPPLNVTYADKNGDIGYYLTGTIPIRPDGNKGKALGTVCVCFKIHVTFVALCMRALCFLLSDRILLCLVECLRCAKWTW